jgi:hypothetical protein
VLLLPVIIVLREVGSGRNEVESGRNDLRDLGREFFTFVYSFAEADGLLVHRRIFRVKALNRQQALQRKEVLLWNNND